MTPNEHPTLVIMQALQAFAIRSNYDGNEEGEKLADKAIKALEKFVLSEATYNEKLRASIEAPLKAEIERLREAIDTARENIRQCGETEIEIGGNVGYVKGIARALDFIDQALAASPAEPEQGPQEKDVVIWPMDGGVDYELVGRYSDEINAEMKHIKGYRPPVLIMRATEVQRRIEATP